jgi:hypothetical protein
MRVERDWLRGLAFEVSNSRRFTQDSPVLPEVWLSGGVAYCRSADTRVDLLLTPHKDETAAVLARAVLDALAVWFSSPETAPSGSDYGRLTSSPEAPLTKPTWTVSVNQTTVAASLTLAELVICVLPLSPWWHNNVDFQRPRKDSRFEHDASQREAEIEWMTRLVGTISRCAREPSPPPEMLQVPDNFPWVLSQVERHAQGATVRDYRRFRGIAEDTAGNRRVFDEWVAEAREASSRRRERRPQEGGRPSLWSVGLNRQTFVAIERSVAATKADAARRVFDIKCNDLAWAILDSGIDAEHPAFEGPVDPVTGFKTRRVRASYDFTGLRQLLSLDSHPTTGPSSMLDGVDLEEADRQFKRMRQRLRSGQSLDWAQLEPLLDISLGRPNAYRPPKHDHGTHVAGILAAEDTLDIGYRGMCPDISLYDFRVLDDEGRGEEFEIIAALQFIRYLNARGDQPIIHGVNLSLSLLHDVENFACGRTPICDECERLVASGVVVVAAAGNRGYERVLTSAGEIEAYRAISITDPGNAEAAITVGATHRFQPHTYGVSYFSSRGPTGDGRNKPDVLGPGERVFSTLPGGRYGAKDGTSMAAPHVSGVAALLMARHREFLTQPARVKKIICSTATDLGRERYFQGFGMVDALRALQSV